MPKIGTYNLKANPFFLKKIFLRFKSAYYQAKDRLQIDPILRGLKLEQNLYILGVTNNYR